MYVEAECDESRGMGTEAYRETKRVTGMGCRTSAADESTPNRSFRRLGAKDLTARVGFLACLKPQICLLTYSISAPHRSVVQYSILFYFYPLDLCYNNSTVMTIYKFSRTRGPRLYFSSFSSATRVTFRLCKSPN